VVLVLALGGCGGAQKTITVVGPARASVAGLCFTLKARLEGIQHTAAMNSPQPATLQGRLPAERVSRASSEAIEVSRQTASELASKDAPAASLHALHVAERSYRRLARRLRRASAANGSEGLAMQIAFLKIAAAELRDCLPQK
jgi:hypothetical protein